MFANRSWILTLWDPSLLLCLVAGDIDVLGIFLQSCGGLMAVVTLIFVIYVMKRLCCYKSVYNGNKWVYSLALKSIKSTKGVSFLFNCVFLFFLFFFFFSYNTPAQAPAVDYADADEVDEIQKLQTAYNYNWILF